MSDSQKVLVVPLLPMREEVIYPKSTTPFFVGRKASMDALERALEGDRKIFVVTQRNSSVEEPKFEDLYDVGVLGKIMQVMRLPNGTVKALFEGQHRARLLGARMRDEYIGQVEVLQDVPKFPDQLEDSAKRSRKLFESYVRQMKKKVRGELMKAIRRSSLEELADLITPQLELSRDQKQELLGTPDPGKRLEMVNAIIDVLRSTSRSVSRRRRITSKTNCAPSRKNLGRLTKAGGRWMKLQKASRKQKCRMLCVKRRKRN